MIGIRYALGKGELPNTFILGAARAGTTSLFQWLSDLPTVCTSRPKEVGFFNYDNRSLRGYRAIFSERCRERIRVEATPSYLSNPDVPQRLFNLIDQPRFLILLRNPIDRAISEYWMRVAEGREVRSLADAIDEDREWLERVGEAAANSEFSPAPRTYHSRGLYLPQIKRWMSVSDRSRFFFIRSEDMFASPNTVLDGVLGFLGVERPASYSFQARNVGTYREACGDLRRHLVSAFKPFREELRELTGIGWPELEEDC